MTSNTSESPRPEDQNDTAALMADADRKAREERGDADGQVSEAGNSFADAETSEGGADAVPDAHG